MDLTTKQSRYALYQLYVDCSIILRKIPISYAEWLPLIRASQRGSDAQMYQGIYDRARTY